MTTPTQESRAAAIERSVDRTVGVLQYGRFTREQVDLLKKTVAKGASDDEFALFLYNCERTGLDPFAKQIYCLKRRTWNEETKQFEDAMVTQTGIDGFRLIAERTKKYRGQKAPVFYDKGGNKREVWLDPKVPPSACMVGVLKDGFEEPLYAIAVYDEYVQRKKDGNPNKQWKEKPTIMLAKCAEALALRKAFPQELSGLYSEEEMPSEHEDDTPTHIPATATRPRIQGQQGRADVNGSGEVVLSFGRYRDQPLPSIPSDYLVEQFREPWRDVGRKQAASERLGVGFVSALYAELERRGVPDDMPLRVVRLKVRVAAGEVLTDEDAEELRMWELDHPVPKPEA